jgi:hypothetical protein
MARKRKKNDQSSEPNKCRNCDYNLRNLLKIKYIDSDEEYESDEEVNDGELVFPDPDKKFFAKIKIKKRLKSNRYLKSPPFEVYNWKDLLKLAKMSKKKMFKDCQKLPALVDVLTKIDSLVGLNKIKNELVTFILLYCQQEKLKLKNKQKLKHIILSGPPGVGKSTLSIYLAELLCIIHNMKNNHVVFGSSRNMIASYVGHTAKATQHVINHSLGGILLIDEAYSIGGNPEQQSFALECVNTLNENLTSQNLPGMDGFICIIIGYKQSLQNSFFSLNRGLERRFNTVFELNKYNASELYEMFKRKSKDSIFKCDDDLTDFFKENESLFIHHAASVDDLVNKIELMYIDSLFGKSTFPKITKKFIEKVTKKTFKPKHKIPSFYF